MGAKHVLDETFKIVNAAGVGRFLAVEPTAIEGECELNDAAGELVLGLTQEAQATQNENVTVRTYGVSRFVAGSGGVSVGDYLKADGSTGRLIAATFGSSGNPYVLAVSRTATAEGAIGTCFLIHSIAAKTAA